MFPSGTETRANPDRFDSVYHTSDLPAYMVEKYSIVYTGTPEDPP